MDEFDFDFDGSAGGGNLSQESAKTTTSAASSKCNSSRRSHASSSRIKSKRGAETSVSSPSKIRSGKSSGLSRRRKKRKQQQSSSSQNDMEDEVASTVSSSSSKDSASMAAQSTSSSVSLIRSKNRVSVRAAGSGAYAVQDAGNYQMLHDECAFLCSTILSRRHHPAKAVDAILDLVTMLSSRKTRSVLWQGAAQDDTPDLDRKPAAKGSSTTTSPPASPPTPKLWTSILEVIAVLTQQQQDGANAMGKSLKTAPGSNASKGNDDARNKATATSPKKGRTKSARRKQREMMQGAGGGSGDVLSVVNSSVGSTAARQQVTLVMPEMKEALACLVYILSWDCTMSDAQSVASIGSYQMPSLARRVRLAILENGPALAGIMKLMMPSESVGVTQKVAAGSAPMSPASSTSERKRLSQRSSSDVPSAPGSPMSPPQMSQSRKKSMANSPSPFDPPSASHSTSSVSFADEPGNGTLSTGENPAKLGRKNRLKRKRLAREAADQQATLSDKMATIPESVGRATEDDNKDSEMMPPPSKRVATATSILSNGNLSFPASSAKKTGSSLSWEEDFSLGSDATGLSFTLSARASQKLAALREKIQLEALARSQDGQAMGSSADDVGTNLQKAFYFERPSSSSDADPFTAGDYPWVSMVCLESLNRIVSGKEEGGKSCLEEQDPQPNKRSDHDDESDSDEDESSNPIFVTNRLVGKSGVVPLLSTAMRQSLAAASKLIFDKGRQGNNASNPTASAYDETTLRDDDECWKYCQDRLSMLASLIDGACLLSESNRRGFCEEDPFAFEDKKDGLIFDILKFLRQCSQSDLSLFDEKRSETMLLALRMLTSLTHDNALAAEQMAETFKDVTAQTDGWGNDTEIEEDARGVEILAELIFRLEESLMATPSKSNKRSSLGTLRRANDHDMHRYDSTIFCMNTMANVVEGTGVRQMLTELTVQPESLGSISWLTWLCQWFVEQTETFQDEIMSIGKTSESSGSSKHDASSAKQAAANADDDGDFQKHEEEKLVAAGNCCVVLACLMSEPDTDDPESCTAIRKVIMAEMPVGKEGKSYGVSMIINTLKAFCNYYHLSLGELSLAVIAPVKRLIMELEEMDDLEDVDGNS